MVIAKVDSLTRKLPKRGSILFADKVRPHAVPDDYNNVARLVEFLRSQRWDAKQGHCKYSY